MTPLTVTPKKSSALSANYLLPKITTALRAEGTRTNDGLFDLIGDLHDVVVSSNGCSVNYDAAGFLFYSNRFPTVVFDPEYSGFFAYGVSGADIVTICQMITHFIVDTYNCVETH
jgi:hypothetical protein